MDVEKLIEHLERRGLSNGSSLGPHSGLYDEAADAFTALLAENEKLRAELEQKSKLIAQQAAELERRDTLLKEQEAEAVLRREKECRSTLKGQWHLPFWLIFQENYPLKILVLL